MAKKFKKNESSLKDHKQNKKELNPPFLAHGFNMKTSSWFDERLPEMLWAVLVIGNMERDKALDFFRYVAKFVEKKPDCSNITISGISKLEDIKRKALINHMCVFSKNVNDIFRVLLLFPDLPAIESWKEYLEEPNIKEDWNKLGDGVSKTFWHQSQEATDCRWIKILCEILGGKIKFAKTMEDTVRGILEYPNYGDMRSVCPSIRAMEIGPRSQNEEDSVWAKYFWKYCFDNTGCTPEEAVNKKIQSRQKKLSEEMEETRKHYFDDTVKLRNDLIDYFFETSEISAIDSRHEGAFGLAMYALSLYIETIFYRTSLSITGRLGLRALVETYITFTYLLKKERDEPKVWDDYRSYGIGQTKLIYLKLQETKNAPECANLEEMDHIANEDKWVEFIPINLGHWDTANLRKMSEDVGLKDLYDKFYNYTSGFMHGNWGAVRESVYQTCINPLHRYHRVPTYDLPLMPSTANDARKIMNSIFDCLSKAYPEFEYRLTKVPKEE